MSTAQINPDAFLASSNGNGGPPELSQQAARRKRELLVSAGSQAPSARDMNALAFDMASGMGPTPFSSRRISLNHCYEMRTDAVIALTMLFARMPLLSARWFIECKNPRKAQFLQEAIKRIYGRFVLQWTTKWEFGWQSLVKPFYYDKPDWTFIDRSDPEEKVQRVWPEGDIPAMLLDDCIPLKPETVTPRWNEDGSFGGIYLSAGFGGYSFPTIIEMPVGAKGSALTANSRRYVDVEHSIWAVNNRDSTFGSVWGYPRTGYSFKFWWAYEMLLAILGRSVERKADPPVKVDYPDTDEARASDGKNNQEVAFEIGRNTRAGSTLAIPSERYVDENDRPSPQRMWDVGYLTGGEDFDKVVEVLSYLDTMKIRSQLKPEQALTEGRGGTSSRNVAGEMGEQGQRMAIFDMTELADDINRLIIPQLSEYNFPELRGSSARFVFKDLGTQDLELFSTLLQAAANKDGTIIPLDYEAMADQLNIPTLSPEHIAARVKQLAAQATTQKPPAVEAQPGGNAGVTDTGFYYEAPDLIAFADDQALLLSLPSSKHFKDSAVLATTRLVRKLMRERYTEQYEGFADYLEEGDLELADDADLDDSKSVVDQIMSGWNYTSSRGKQIVKRVSQALSTVFSRAGRLELRSANLSTDTWKPDEKELKDWMAKRTGSMLKSVDDTVKAELQRFLLKQMEKDKNAKQIAAAVRKHFSDFPNWKADRLARSEVTLVYNAATLFAGQAAGIKQVQALDARFGPSDIDCEERNGRLFSIEDAFREIAKEHPNGTLAWRYIKGAPLSIVRVDEGESPDFMAYLDDDSRIIYLRKDLNTEAAARYLAQVGQHLELAPMPAPEVVASS